MPAASCPANKIDGEDRWPLIAGQPDAKPRETFYYYAGDELQAVRSGRWKLHLPHEYLSPAQPPGKNGKPANFENLKPAVDVAYPASAASPAATATSSSRST